MLNDFYLKIGLPLCFGTFLIEIFLAVILIVYVLMECLDLASTE